MGRAAGEVMLLLAGLGKAKARHHGSFGPQRGTERKEDLDFTCALAFCLLHIVRF